MTHLSSQRITPETPSAPETASKRPLLNSSLGYTLLQPLVWLTVLSAAFIAPMRAQNDFSARFEEIKKSATDEQLYRFLYDLPKRGDLHNHQDCAVCPEWWDQVAT